MTTQVKVPALGESIKQAVLLKWNQPDGQRVAVDDVICELETDKLNTDLRALVGGYLRHAKKEGDVVAVGDVVALIEDAPVATAKEVPRESPAKPAADATKAALSPAGSVAATIAAKTEGAGTAPTRPPSDLSFGDYSPAVRRLLEENRLNARAVETIKRTGPGERLTKQDVENYLADQSHAGNGNQITSQSAGTAQKLAPGVTFEREESEQRSIAGKSAASSSGSSPASSSVGKPAAGGRAEAMKFDADGIYREPMSKIRKFIAERLVSAQQTAAILTTVNEIDMQAVMDLRSKYKDRFAQLHGVGLGFMSFFARAVVLALREFPRVNAFIEGDQIVYHNYVNLGIAVSTERGLVVPVLRHVENMSFARVESEIKRLAGSARENRADINELSGGTFTITNGGIYGSLLSTPILTPPQSGILGMHAIQQRPVAINGKVEIRPMMYVALSYDHRLVDGRESVSFLVRVKQYMEDPSRALLEI